MKKNKDQVSNEDSPREYKKDFQKEYKKDKLIICYKCNKLGHVKEEYALAKKLSKFPKKGREKP